jgi:hypothetical protein
VLCARIDHDEEYILTAIAGSYPHAVWRFFKARLDRAATKERDEERYEDIPFQLHELVQPLSQDPSFAVDTVRSWYAADPNLFQYRGGKLLHNVFPGFSSALGAKLVAVVHEGTDAAINFVLMGKFVGSCVELGIHSKGNPLCTTYAKRSSDAPVFLHFTRSPSAQWPTPDGMNKARLSCRVTVPASARARINRHACC